MQLPNIQIRLANSLYGLPEKGNLTYEYLPFQNLIMSDTSEISLGPLQLSSEKAGINIGYPLTIEAEPAYDDSINLIITDEVNPPKIINSRFYQTSTMTYEIADRKGNLDTNIYSEDNFKIETSLIKTTRTVMSIEFLGVSSGGKLPVGTYTLYLKLADADGNETDFIAESGRIVCHVGSVNSPASIRGGQQNENSEKVITCKVNNLDLAYDYIHVYYTRGTGDGTQEFTKAYKIHDKYKITSNDTIISITGYEQHEEIGLEEINVQLTSFDSVKTLANCQNISFIGNTTNSYDLFKTLEKYSLFITPQVAFDQKGIGNLNHLYTEQFDPINGYEYHNVNNIYYKLSYWDQDIYRVGIVYILPDYTLSPVFNIRGIKTLTKASNDPQFSDFVQFGLDETIKVTENYLIEKSLSKLNKNWENSKGVFKIDVATPNMFNTNQSVKPIGLKFYFPENLIEGDETFKGLKNLTKGFFFVRQKRIPTILAQGVGIGTSLLTGLPTPLVSSNSKGFFNKYIAQSFLTLINGYSQLKASFFSVPKVVSNALLCPEAANRKQLLGTFFNSSEYTLYTNKYKSSFKSFNDLNTDNEFTYKWLIPINDFTVEKPQISEVTLVEPGIAGLRNSKYTFSSKAGDATIVHKHLDPVLGDYEDPTNTNTAWNDTATKVRGEFNTFLGLSTEVQPGQYYNIFQKGYDFEQSWQNYFLVRYNDSSPFYPISDRTSWDNITTITPLYFRGDCYINTYTHRMNWNFIDPDLPTNKKIVDPFCWAVNFKIKRKASTIVDADAGSVTTTTTLVYNKLLDIFTYKDVPYPDARKDDGTAINDEESGDDLIAPVAVGLIEPDGKKFKKYSEINGLFGTNKINRPDVNAVPLGYWLTFKICSNVNLAMRDVDWTRSAEEALHKQKRGFYPLQSMDSSNPLPESDIINNGISQSVGHKHYFEIPDVPFIKTNFATRIHYSNILQNSLFTNGNRVFTSNNYLDYSREYGALIKLVEWYGTLIGVMEHGIIMIPVNERAMMKNTSGENIYINTDNVLPKNPKVLSNTFGSFWPESIIKTPQFIYGIDTVGKKIWRTNGEQFEIISDLKIQKFLNDNIKLLEIEKDRTVGVNYVKTHYNAFKQDVLFTFNYNNKKWHLCWNEILNKWVTQYTWFPEFSENINNIFYTFANQSNHANAGNKLYKHGFAGVEEELGNILPTKWYDEQFPFEYEFVVVDLPGVQKIYDNLQIISNLAEPNSFYFEIVGEGFDWNQHKELIRKLNDVTIPVINSTTLTTDTVENRNEDLVKTRYTEYLADNLTLKKLPYIYLQSFDVNDPNSFFRDRGELTIPFSILTTKDLSLRHHNKLKENLVNVYQKGVDLKKYGNLKGNMQYLEDSWRVQIQPISFTYAYVVREIVIGEGDAPQENWILKFSKLVDMHIRDKYLKVRVKYSGTQYAIINAVRTLYTASYA